MICYFKLFILSTMWCKDTMFAVWRTFISTYADKVALLHAKNDSFLGHLHRKHFISPWTTYGLQMNCRRRHMCMSQIRLRIFIFPLSTHLFAGNIHFKFKWFSWFLLQIPRTSLGFFLEILGETILILVQKGESAKVSLWLVAAELIRSRRRNICG